MKIKGDIRIGYIQGRDTDTVHLTITDIASGTEFLEIEMTLEQYGFLCASRSSLKADVDVVGLDRIGKKMLVERREVHAPELPYSSGNENYALWLDANFKEEGWTRDRYLGSRNSVRPVQGVKGQVILSFHVRKWVDAED